MTMMRKWLLSSLLACGTAFALPPPDANPEFSPWFDSLRAPRTNMPCCSISDCRPVDARIAGNGYEVFIEGTWRKVPEHTILPRHDNPTGRPVACWTPQAGIMCFVKGPEG